MSEKKQNSREIAARIITDWLNTEDFPDRMLDGIENDRPFIMELVYGCVRRRRTLEWIIKRYTTRQQRHFITACLMVGIYQLFFMDDVAEHAAINETVEASKNLSISASGFVNGILRSFQRELATVRQLLPEKPLGIRESHPEILVRRWKNTFGAPQAEALCIYNNTRPQTVITPNILKTTVQAFTDQLVAAKIDVTPHPFMPDRCLILPRGTSVTSLPGYTEGLFSVQDPATISAVTLLDPQPGEYILDACAAPGGKTILIGQFMQERGRLVAAEIHRDRFHILRENIKRMCMKNTSAVRLDASNESEMEKEANGQKYDKILLDAPCSNTGVLRRRPDARWRFSEKRLKELVFLQESLLNSASKFIRPGGMLVYSTCSLEPEEGETLVNSWLTKNTDFSLDKTILTWPPDTQTDGAFAASIRRA